MNPILYSFKIESQSSSGQKNLPIPRKVESTSLDDTVNRVARDLINKGYENISVSFKKTEEGIRNPKALQNFKRVGKKWEFIPKDSESSEEGELKSSSSKGKEKVTNKKAYSFSSRTGHLPFMDFPQEMGEFILDYCDYDEELYFITICKQVFYTYISHFHKRVLEESTFVDKRGALSLDRISKPFKGEVALYKFYSSIKSVDFADRWCITDLHGHKNLHFPSLVKVEINGLSDDQVKKFTQEYPQLKEMCLKSRVITDLSLKILEENCTSLTSLTLKDTQLSVDGLLTFVANCSRLKSIELIPSLANAHTKLFAEKCSKLTYLDFNENLRGPISDYEELAKNCPSLKTLILPYQVFTHKNFEPFTSCFSLQNIKITVSLLSDSNKEELIEIIGKFASLQSLEINFAKSAILKYKAEKKLLTPFVSSLFFKALSQFTPRLNTLILQVKSSIEDEDFKYLSKLPNLKILFLKDCQKITDEGLILLSKKCRKLRKVTLRKAVKISDQGLKALSQNAIHIKSLSIRNAHFSLKGITELAQNCRGLSYLDLKGCGFSDGRGMNQLFKEFPHLTIDNLEGWKIGKEAFGAVSRKVSKTLHQI